MEAITKISQSENNKRIAKNTIILYFRMLLTMGVSLFTVRIVLDTLGTVDYGLYSVIGGVVSMFSFLSGTMASASQRFFAYELGRKNYDQLKKTFSMTMTIYIIIAVVILILSESIGLWFLNHKMTIPSERMEAARWVYQFTILSFMLTVLTTPYYASIIAHEKMKIYAFVSIIEVILKLLIVYLLVLFSFDKLKLYSVLMFGTTAIVTFFYRSYCKRTFNECRYAFSWDQPLFKEIVTYSGWNLIGSFAWVLKNQGLDIVLNIFFGPAVNAARGIAAQIKNSINQFVQNFMTATIPQIIKYYAADQRQEMIKLVFQSSKISYFLLFIISMPVLLETDYILSLWLKDIPEFAVVFTRLVVIAALIETLAFPLRSIVQATGKVKKYQATVGGIALLNIPASFIFLKLGYPPQTVFWVVIVIEILLLMQRLVILKELIRFSVVNYLSEVIARLIFTSLLAYVVPAIIHIYYETGISRFLLTFFTGIIFSGITIYFIGLSKGERQILINIIKRRIATLKK